MPFYPFLGEGSLKIDCRKKSRYPYSILSTGGPPLKKKKKRSMASGCALKPPEKGDPPLLLCTSSFPKFERSAAFFEDMLDLQGRRRGEWVEAISLAQDADALVCTLALGPPTSSSRWRAMSCRICYVFCFSGIPPPQN